MGSATFALPTLDALFEAGRTITAVITQPDKPAGRGQAVQGPPVKKRAFDLHLPIYQPASLKTDEARQLFEALAPDLIVVVAYGKILPRWLLELPKHGCLNLHGSLLPKYRGAAPVHWAIANGEERTGNCTMLLDEGLDTGAVYLCEETAVGPDERTPELYERLARLGAPLMVKTVDGIANGILQPKPQDHSQATFAPVLKKQDGFLNWSRSAREIHNRVRAFNPWPGTVTKFRDQICKVLRTKWSEADGRRPPLQSEMGAIVASKGQLLVACGDGNPIEILSIQPANRKAISGADFANGLRLRPGEKFETVMDN
jgi:methionyl-tRNA formyltransferase